MIKYICQFYNKCDLPNCKHKHPHEREPGCKGNLVLECPACVTVELEDNE